jgi:DNA gyrase subunit A
MREEDEVQHILSANTMDSLLIFTNRGKVYQIKVHELPDAGRTAKGLPIVNVISMQPDETVTTMMTVKDYASSAYLFFTTRLGQVKRTSLNLFQSVRSSGMIAIGLEPGDDLAWVRVTSGSDHVVLITRQGQAIRFDENDARPMGRPAAGVIGIRMAKGDDIIASEVVQDGKDLLIVAANGLGKRTSLDHYPSQGRGGKGVTAMKLTPKTGQIVAAAMVSPDQNVMLMNSSGQVIRIPASQISLIGRATQGVFVMRMNPGETVRTMAIADAKTDEDEVSLNGHELS